MAKKRSRSISNKRLKLIAKKAKKEIDKVLKSALRADERRLQKSLKK
jgi:hypothetical protein